MSAPESLEDILLVEMSRRNTDMVTGIILKQPGLFNELFHTYLRNEEPVSRRAAWVIDMVSEKVPSLLTPYLDDMIEILPQFKHDGLKRHTLRMLSRYPLPNEHLGTLMNLCFEWLISTKEAVATKIFCMEILYQISVQEPDLKKELADSIEWKVSEGSPGFRNKAEKMLQKLYREMG